MGSINCTECSKLFSFDVLPRRGAVCFACHIKGIRLGFAYGQEDFHGPTIKQRQDEQMRQATAAGIKAEPIGTRWI